MSIRLLSTKILSTSQKALLSNNQFQLVEYDSLKIDLLHEEIDTSYKHIIFTSQNTVKAYLKNLQNSNNLNGEESISTITSQITAYCVGEKTKALLEEYRIKVVVVTHYGADLSKILVEKFGNESFLFLCGNKRRYEIPTRLKENNIHFKEQVVYENSPNPKAFTAHFNGILFFSPTGIESYQIKNSIKDSIAFCIGTTTAAEAKKHTSNIIIANKPTVESVLEKVVEHYKSKIN
ncbi:uroporphyrinogen-III synthase [Arenibacter certesii]|uniref:Uroporphyrinogen III methyltransferase n=1 Tax=Arenibacter certesii TaxID=228955 RepID=A0A918IZ62_9FLAO|nr:uroporphyrinogen-III synthase [Arenibacter certesii]GGW38158.1 uroporphyrinogen III methyltransferase [Arenibacter certesii]